MPANGCRIPTLDGRIVHLIYRAVPLFPSTPPTQSPAELGIALAVLAWQRAKTPPPSYNGSGTLLEDP